MDATQQAEALELLHIIRELPGVKLPDEIHVRIDALMPERSK
jgi:hypothetical protein